MCFLLGNQERNVLRGGKMGGSGGGGRSLGDDELQRLEDRARASLQGASQPEKRNVFICFANEDLNEVNLLRGQAKNENSDLEFNDWSVHTPFDSNDAEYIRRGIRERMRQSSVTMVYVSQDTAQSRWVDWEIRESINLGKGVIALYKGTNPPANLPPALKEFNIKPIPWSQKEITTAIEKAAQKRP